MAMRWMVAVVVGLWCSVACAQSSTSSGLDGLFDGIFEDRAPKAETVEEMLANDDLMEILRGIELYTGRAKGRVERRFDADNYESDRAAMRALGDSISEEMCPLIPVLERLADCEAVSYTEGSFRGGMSKEDLGVLSGMRVCARMLVQDAERLIEAGDGAAAAERYATVIALYDRIAGDLSDHTVLIVSGACIKIAADSIEAWRADGGLESDAAAVLADALGGVRDGWWAVTKRAIAESAEVQLEELEETIRLLEEEGGHDRAGIAEARALNARYGALHGELMRAWDEENFEALADGMREDSEHSIFNTSLPAILRTRSNMQLLQQQVDALIEHLEGAE